MSVSAESIREAGKAITRPIITVAVVVVVLLIGALIAYDAGTSRPERVLNCTPAPEADGSLVFTVERDGFDEFGNGTITIRFGDCTRIDEATLTAVLDTLVRLGRNDISDEGVTDAPDGEAGGSNDDASKSDESTSDEANFGSGSSG